METLAAWIRDQRLTLLHTAATTYRSFLDTLTDDHALATLRALRLGGEPITGDDLRRFRRRFPAGCALWHAMGPTETLTLCRHVVVPEDQAGDGRVPVGYPAPSKTVLIRDEAGRDVGPGEIGEIVVRSAAVEGGAARALRTLDLGRLDASGALTITGRTSLFINTAGNKVDPAEVEAALRAHPAVADVAVFGVAAAHDEQVVAAAVVLASDVSADTLRAHCRELLAPHKVPRVLTFRDALPRSPLGKVLIGRLLI